MQITMEQLIFRVRETVWMVHGPLAELIRIPHHDGPKNEGYRF